MIAASARCTGPSAVYGRRLNVWHSAARTVGSASTASRSIVLCAVSATPSLLTADPFHPWAACPIALAASARTSGHGDFKSGTMSEISEGRSRRPSARTATRQVSASWL